MWFFALLVVLLIGAVAVVASGRWGGMSTAYDDRPDVSVPARQVLTGDDIRSARFAIGVRGYRMDEVDALLERVAREVAERDRRIADLERAVSPIVSGPEGAGFGSYDEYDHTDFDDTGHQPPILVGGEFPEPARSSERPGTEPVADRPEADQPASERRPEPDPGLPADGEAPAEQDRRSDDEPAPAPSTAGEGLETYPPPPPLIQSLLEERKTGEEREQWFMAKEEPPDHPNASEAAPPPSDADAAAGHEPQESQNPQQPHELRQPRDVQDPLDLQDAQAPDDRPRGRHSAAPPDVVQPPRR